MKPSYAELTLFAVAFCAVLAVHVSTAVPLPSDLSDSASDLEIGRWLLRFLHSHDVSAEKRRPLSVNQDLMSLADMLHADGGKKKMLHAQSFLDSIGKRSQEVDVEAPSSLYQRALRSRVSVGIPLDTLSSMIADQRRRKSAASVHSHLMKVGKRSALTDEQFQQ